MTLKILPEVILDLEFGGDFYEAQGRGLGRLFQDGLMADIERLRVHAGIHPKVHGCHRMLARRFPFAVYYEVRESVVEIWAVLDCRQDPDRIADRLR